ncbi:hypothetical protein MLD38_002197 [Melastoma candidum]|uniref:Uncharacterized protein n=1 Tax=Melastoma candidum TaxID=119954 RepID=A0ACB9SFK7_9MYRT|nr:hypothetical protein MLD38_002197 [Melastoma candidum]
MVKLVEEPLEVVDDAGRMNSQPLCMNLGASEAMSEVGDSTGGGEELFWRPLEQGSQVRGESKTMSGEEFSGRPSERGSPGRGASKTVTAELFPCRVSRRKFRSTKATDSNMRVRSKGKEKCAEGKSREITPRRDLDVVSSTLTDGEEPVPYCSLCRKTFPSKKALYGHLRIHPERPWRGAHPPAEDHIPGQSATGKCGSKIDLSFFAKTHPRYLQLSLMVSVEEDPVAEGNTDAGVKAEVEMPREENPPLDVPRIKAEEAGSENPRTDLRSFKRKARETDVGDIPDPAPDKRYSCCCGLSSEFQSLGSSCKELKKSPENPTTNQPALQMLNLQPQLDLSLSLAPPNSSSSNLVVPAVSNPGDRTIGFDLNMGATLSPEEANNRDGTGPDQN